MTRIQIAVYNKLVAEVIVTNLSEADKLWSKWCNLRYKLKKPMGGACISDASIRRTWDVNVGNEISV